MHPCGALVVSLVVEERVDDADLLSPACVVQPALRLPGVLNDRRHQDVLDGGESLGGRTKTVADSRLCAAIVDRLTSNGAVIETGTESYCPAQTKAKLKSAQTRSTCRATHSNFETRLSLLSPHDRRINPVPIPPG